MSPTQSPAQFNVRPHRGLIRYINWLIALLLAAALLVVYWVAYRPLPQTSGQLSAPLSQKATVVRDALGVPHIHAATLVDAMFLQGYVTAQDRLWQMDALRRLAAGELSEVIGPSTLDADRESRRLRMRRTAEAQARTMPPADRAVLVAYARGVNHFIRTHLQQLPLEFTVLGYDPRPWTVVDSLLAGLQMYRNLTNTYRDELKKQTMLEGGDAAKVNFLFPRRSGREVQPGSNAWAISGMHTASGKPLLANDPHLEYAVPATWYMVHLQAPGLNVTGVSLPGVPCIIVGHNESIAWGVTNLGFDVQDLYQERLDPNSGRYLFNGQQEQARLETEIIPVKGARPVDFRQWITRHGPVIASDINKAYALRWAATEPDSFQFPFADLNRAGNWQEFTAALARFSGPGQNFVYADVDGNIGYHATGLLPLRNGYDGSVPANGSSGQNEWLGFINFVDLPSSYNPPSGLIVTANQNPFPTSYKYQVDGEFAPHYRSRQIRDLLTARNGFKPEDMVTIQKDVYSGFSDYLAKSIVAAYDRKRPNNPALKDAVAVLRSWNGQMEKGTPAPMIAAISYLEYRKRVAAAASPRKGEVYDIQMAPAVLQQILENGGRGWFGDHDAVLLQSLTAALDDGRRLQGSKVANWDYGVYNELTIAQPVGNQLPEVGSYFNIGPIPMSGSSTSVKQTTRKLGPSMRFVADLSDWEKSLNNLTVGESGQILSPHYKDQWNAYYAAHSFPMQFHKIDAKQTLTVQP